MAKKGSVKLGKQSVQTWKHDYGTKSNPFTKVTVEGQTRYIQSTDKYAQKPGESLDQLYKRLAKQADQRLVRLEKLSQEKDFKNVTKFAYARAQDDLKRWGGTRFNQQKPKDKRRLKAKIKDIQTFLRSQTSTKGGIIKTYQARADTINKKYGTDFTWQELANYFESDLANKDDKSLGGSGTRLQAYYQTKRDINPDDVIEANEKHKITDDPVSEVAARLRALNYDYATING